MNRKSNPWVALVALILLTLILCTFTGCEDEATAATEAAETDGPRFIVEDATAKTLGPHQHVEIITDTETGVRYIFFKSSNAGGLAVLEQAPEKEG